MNSKDTKKRTIIYITLKSENIYSVNEGKFYGVCISKVFSLLLCNQLLSGYHLKTRGLL